MNSRQKDFAGSKITKTRKERLSLAENKPEKKLEEANFEVSSLAEVKDENGNGVFHMRTKTKVILFFSIVILLAAGALIFLALENFFAAEVWQFAVWGLCGVLAIYSIFARSIPALLLNFVLFFGVSLIPVWQAGHETFRPVIEKFTSSPEQVEEKITPPVEDKKIPEPETKSAEQNIPEPEKTTEVEKDSTEPANARTKPLISDLPSI